MLGNASLKFEIPRLCFSSFEKVSLKIKPSPSRGVRLTVQAFSAFRPGCSHDSPERGALAEQARERPKRMIAAIKGARREKRVQVCGLH
jgi:hypothetical protein